MFPWKSVNRILYRAWYRARNGPVLALSRRWTGDFLEWKGPPREEGRILVLAWGRIGDVVLSHPFLAGLRRTYPGERITWVGRPETRFLLEGKVDRFLPFSPQRWRSDRSYREDFLSSVWKKWKVVAGDVHFFFGGLFFLGPLARCLPAEEKFFYEGYAPPPDLAPWRPFPGDAVLVASLPKEADRKGDPRALHVYRDTIHFVSRIYGPAAEREGPPASMEEAVFPLEGEEGGPGRFGAEGGPYIVVQPGSNSPRRSYPAGSWRKVLGSFPGERFFVLGTERERGAAGALGLPNVVDLSGKTSLRECVSLIRGARAFLGLDSGLAHIAAHLGKPALCLVQSSNLGYFVPYPPDFPGRGPVAVSDPDFLECSGCFMVCSRESLAANAGKGLPCLRSIPPGRAVEALGDLLEGRD